jgi:hypothetical protein
VDLLPLAFGNLTASIASLLWLVLGAVKVWALVDGARRQGTLYPAAGKQTKTLWMLFLGLGLAFHLISGVLSLVNLAGTIAAIVYLVSVRPAIDALTGRRGRNDGPYGQW